MVLGQDWFALIDLTSNIPAKSRGELDNLNLSKAHLKLGQYQQSMEIEKLLSVSNSAAMSVEAQAVLKLGM